MRHKILNLVDADFLLQTVFTFLLVFISKATSDLEVILKCESRFRLHVLDVLVQLNLDCLTVRWCEVTDVHIERRCTLYPTRFTRCSPAGWQLMRAQFRKEIRLCPSMVRWCTTSNTLMLRPPCARLALPLWLWLSSSRVVLGEKRTVETVGARSSVLKVSHSQLQWNIATVTCCMHKFQS